jgi:hypothetical protein
MKRSKINKKFKLNETTARENIIKNLIPWFVSIAIYFILYTNSKSDDIKYLIIKLLPMISLCLFVHLSRGKEYIFYALVFSTIGDGLLVFKE